MYLYELALELDVRSPELVERATALGLTGLGPSTELTAAQVASLRAGVPLPPPGSGSVAPAAPASPSSTGGGPVSWSPATEPTTGDPAAGPTASTTPVRSSLPPPPGRGPGVPVTPSAGPAPLEASALGPPRAGGADARPPARRRRLAIAGVAAVAIGAAVAFMAASTGISDERKAALAAEDADARDAATEAEEDRRADLAAFEDAVAQQATTAPAAPPGSSPEVPDPEEPVDLAAYCQGFVPVAEFFADDGRAPDGSALTFEATRDAMLATRDEVARGFELMVAGAPPARVADVEVVGDRLLATIDAIGASSGEAEAAAATEALAAASVEPELGRVVDDVRRRCT